MDTQELADIMYGYKVEKRAEWFELLKDSVFKPSFNFPSRDALFDDPWKKMNKIFESKIVSVLDFVKDPHNVFAAHEFVAMIDGSLGIKFTV